MSGREKIVQLELTVQMKRLIELVFRTLSIPLDEASTGRSGPGLASRRIMAGW